MSMESPCSKHWMLSSSAAKVCMAWCSRAVHPLTGRKQIYNVRPVEFEVGDPIALFDSIANVNMDLDR